MLKKHLLVSDAVRSRWPRTGGSNVFASMLVDMRCKRAL